MAAPRMSVVVVVGGIVLAAAAGAYYFFAVFSKDEQLRSARAQVATWEAHWQETRKCLLGEAPLADTFAHALLARELSVGTAKEAFGDCTKPIGQLTRPPGNNTGMDGVEEAWQSLDKLAIEAAQAYVIHLREPLSDDKLPAALTALAAARAELRRQVELPPDGGAMGPAPSPLLAQPIEAQGQPFGELVRLPSTDGMLAIGEAGPRDYVLRIRSVDKLAKVVEAKPLASNEVAAVLPELSWGAGADGGAAGSAELGELLAGPLDAEGKVALASAKLVAKGRGLSASAAVGTGADRAIIYRDDKSLHVALSKDSGATWKSQPLAPGRDDVHVLQGEGYADVIWSEVAATGAEGDEDEEGDEGEEGVEGVEGVGPRGEVRWVRVEAARLPVAPDAKAAVIIPNAIQRFLCNTPTAPWVLARSTDVEMRWVLVNLLDPQKPIKLEDDELSEIVDCDAETALLANPHEQTLWTCKRSGECKQLPWRAQSALGVLHGGAPLVVASRHQLAALLPTEGPPRFIALPEGSSLYGVYPIDGAVHLAVQKKSGGLLIGAVD